MHTAASDGTLEGTALSSSSLPLSLLEEVLPPFGEVGGKSADWRATSPSAPEIVLGESLCSRADVALTAALVAEEMETGALGATAQTGAARKALRLPLTAVGS